jgi:chromosomal replication initiation ATPase DnaA
MTCSSIQCAGEGSPVAAPEQPRNSLHETGERRNQAASGAIAHRGCELVTQMIAAVLDVPYGEIASMARGGSRAAFARQCSMYVAHVTLGLSCSEIGRAFGRDRTTAAYACRRVEDRREDPAIDALLASLECASLMLRHRTALRVHP